MYEIPLSSPNGNSPGMRMIAKPHDRPKPPDKYLAGLPDIPAVRWLRDFEEWHADRAARSLPAYRRTVALWLLSTVALGRVKVHSHEEMNTQLFMLMIGESSIFAKTTAAKQAMKVMHAIDDDLARFIYLSSNSTIQKFVYDLTNKSVPKEWEDMPDSARQSRLHSLAWTETRSRFIGEAGGLLKKMAKGDEAHFIIRQLYDGNGSFGQDTILRDKESGDNVYCPLLFDLTYADIKPHAKQGHSFWSDGFWARYMFIGSRPDDYPPIKRNKNVPIPASVLNPLKEWHNRLGIPTATVTPLKKRKGDGVLSHEVSVTPAAGHDVQADDFTPGRELLEEYHDWAVQTSAKFRDGRMSDFIGNYVRLTTNATKIAGMFASMDGLDEITEEYAQAGIAIMEQFRHNLHDVYEQIQNTKEEVSEESQIMVKLANRLALKEGNKNFGPQSKRDLLKRTKLTVAEGGPILSSMIFNGLVEENGKSLSLTVEGYDILS